MTTLYAVTAGIYSDYRVKAIFSTRELAEKYMNDNDDEWYIEIEEYELDMARQIPKEYFQYRVNMDKDGNTSFIDRLDPFKFEEQMHIIISKGYQNKYWLDIVVTAKNEEHAIKIANEKRTMLIASGKWDDLVKGKNK